MNKSIWLARLLYHHKEGLTKQEILNAWADEDDYGRPMATSTFYDNRGYLESRFGMRIECRNGRYRLTTEVPDSEALLRQLLDDSGETNDKGEREPGKEWLTPLADAVANNKHVEVGYAPLDKAPYTTTLSPYFLHRIRGHCYVVAKSSRHREIRNFAIDRITQLTPLHTTFRRPSDLNASHWFATSFGAFAGTHLQAERVTLQPLTPRLLAYFRNRPLHSSQREELMSNGESFFHYDIAITPDFIGTLLTLGADIRIVSPDSLRHHIALKAQAIVDCCQSGENVE